MKIEIFDVSFVFTLGCPASKYGANCEHTCRTCWNGGVCEHETGICICPPGYQGEQCETGVLKNVTICYITHVVLSIFRYDVVHCLG